MSNMEHLRENTAKIQFQTNDLRPTDKEMISFVFHIGLTSKDIHTLYQDLYDRCIYIKFCTLDKYQYFITSFRELTFQYGNGNETKVTINAVSGMTKYIRIFNLPPEIEDSALSGIFSKYGTVQSFYKEKFGINSLLPVFSGVRGVYMVMFKEIPQFLFITNVKVRIYYDGMRDKYFGCGYDAHTTEDYPTRKVEMETENNITEMTTTNMMKPNKSTNIQIQYSQVVLDNTFSKKPLDINKRNIERHMFNANDYIRVGKESKLSYGGRRFGFNC